MLGYHNFRHTAQVVTTIILINLIIFRTVNKTHHIGILLDGSGFTKVTQLRAFTVNTFTTLHTTIQLRQGYNGNVQLLCQSFQRTGYRTNLFLTATECHTTRIHQLKVVNNNDSHPMFTHQTTCFGPEFKHRQRRSIVHIKRSIQQVFQFVVQLLPLIACQLSTFDLLTRNLTNIGDKTVDQLDVTHFKREQRYRIPIINSNILSHRKYESCLTHGRTGSDYNKVGVLPTGGHLVQFRKSTFKTTQTVRSCSRFLNQLIRFVNYRINLRIVFLHILLGNLKQLAFRLLHQVVHIQCLIKSLALNITGKRYQFARQRFLCNNTGVIFDMCGRSNLTAQLSNIERSTDLFQLTSFAQLLFDRQNVHRLLINGKISNGSINQLMTMLIK